MNFRKPCHLPQPLSLPTWLSLCSLTVLFLLGCGEAPDKGNKAKRGPREVLVETALVRREPLAPTVSTTGTLAAKTEVKITSQSEGQIEFLNVEEGNRVSQGQVLVRLNRDVLAAQHAKAVAVLEDTRVTLERTRELFKRGMESKQRLDAAATRYEVAQAEKRLLKTQLDFSEIRSPLGGIVTDRRVDPGDVVESHAHLLTVADLSRLVVRTEVSELLIPHLTQGQRVDLKVDALPQRRFAGRIVRIFPQVDPKSRLGTVEVEVAGSLKGLRPGLLCRVGFSTASRSDTLVIPLDALKTDLNGKAFVYRIAGQAVERVPLVLGRRGGKRVEVKEGLQPGERVVVKGFHGLKPGVPVRDVTPKADTPAPSAHP